MRANRLEKRETGACVLRVALVFGLATTLRQAQSVTFRMAAEFVDNMSEDIDLSNFKGAVHVDEGVVRHERCLKTQISFEGMDEHDLERARAVVSVTEDQTDLLV